MRSDCQVIVIQCIRNREEAMNRLVVLSVLVVFLSTWNVDCAPEYYSRRVSSTTNGDGYTNTITEIDDNGRREVTRDRKPGIPQQLDFGFDDSIRRHRISDLNHRFQSPFDDDFHNNNFGWNHIDRRDPIKLQMPDFESNFPFLDEIRSRFNRIDDGYQTGFIPQQINTIPRFSEPLRDFRGNELVNDEYSIHKKGFSSTITKDGHSQHKGGATTTINDNGRVATYTVGDRPDFGPRGTNYF